MLSTHVPQPAEGYVYVMECAGYYKIGWAKTNPRKRLSSVQVGNPLPITLVGVIEGSQMVESDWHAAFRDKRIRGEWFALTSEDVACVLHESYGIDNTPAFNPDGKPRIVGDEGVDWIPPDDEPA